MSKKKVLLVTQELEPYTTLTTVSKIVKKLPKFISEENYDVRILMPRFGTINERRHRLHEVVRLSGMNVIVDNDDYPLIIKVASYPGVRLQVYFLDNDEFFKRKTVFEDKDGKMHPDNSERMIFFCKGVMETVRKFGWPPDIIHCHGWMTSLVPLYKNTAYKNDPIFDESKLIYSIYDSPYDANFEENFERKASINNMKESDLKSYYVDGKLDLTIGAVKNSDAVTILDTYDNPPVVAEIEKEKKPCVVINEDDYLDAFGELYKQLLEE